MSRPNPVILLAALALFGAALAGLGIARGGLFVDKHDGDTLHLVELVMRMARGELPHLDFMTPIGVLAVAPIAVFVRSGAGVGHAFLYAQALVAAVLLLPAWWVGWSRFRGGWGVLYGAAILVLCLALIHGEAAQNLSASMHYNRWAWAAAFVAVGIAYLPPLGAERPGLDGAVLGLVMAALVLTKVTYVVALTGPLAAMLMLRGAARTLAIGLGVAAAALLLFTLWSGIGYWQAYIGDLLTVARSAYRDYPSEPFATVVSGPAYLPGTLLGLAVVVLLRQAGLAAAGLGVLLLLPAVIYITFQNFANDPQWLLLLALLAVTLRPGPGMTNAFGWDLRTALGLVAAALFALAAPSYVNMAFSPIRHLNETPADYYPVFPNAARNGDLYIARDQAARYDVIRAGDGPGSGMEGAAELVDRDDPAVLNGVALPECQLKSGLMVWMQTIAADLVAAGYGDGSHILTADLLSVLWLFEDGLEPVEGAAPWTYGGIPGWDNADYLLVPVCPVAPKVRKQWLDTLAERGVALKEVRATPLYHLMARASETPATE